MSLNRISELIGVSRPNSIFLNSIKLANMTCFNELNVKQRNLRDENPSIFISGVWSIPFRSFKEIKTIIHQLLLHNKKYKLT